jgi:hypothetical protein
MSSGRGPNIKRYSESQMSCICSKADPYFFGNTMFQGPLKIALVMELHIAEHPQEIEYLERVGLTVPLHDIKYPPPPSRFS